jgi:hypothetical protein
MPPVAISAIVKIALGAASAAAAVHWLVKEARRLSEELERMRAPATVEPVVREALPTLRRDPKTGEWRVM